MDSLHEEGRNAKTKCKVKALLAAHASATCDEWLGVLTDARTRRQCAGRHTLLFYSFTSDALFDALMICADPDTYGGDADLRGFKPEEACRVGKANALSEALTAIHCTSAHLGRLVAVIRKGAGEEALQSMLTALVPMGDSVPVPLPVLLSWRWSWQARVALRRKGCLSITDGPVSPGPSTLRGKMHASFAPFYEDALAMAPLLISDGRAVSNPATSFWGEWGTVGRVHNGVVASHYRTAEGVGQYVSTHYPSDDPFYKAFSAAYDRGLRPSAPVGCHSVTITEAVTWLALLNAALLANGADACALIGQLPAQVLLDAGACPTALFRAYGRALEGALWDGADGADVVTCNTSGVEDAMRYLIAHEGVHPDTSYEGRLKAPCRMLLMYISRGEYALADDLIRMGASLAPVDGDVRTVFHLATLPTEEGAECAGPSCEGFSVLFAYAERHLGLSGAAALLAVEDAEGHTALEAAALFIRKWCERARRRYAHSCAGRLRRFLKEMVPLLSDMVAAGADPRRPAVDLGAFREYMPEGMGEEDKRALLKTFPPPPASAATESTPEPRQYTVSKRRRAEYKKEGRNWF